MTESRSWKPFSVRHEKWPALAVPITMDVPSGSSTENSARSESLSMRSSLISCKSADMEVFLIMPTTPEGKAKLSKELAKFHAEQALKMVQKLPCSTEQKLELIDAVVEHLRSKQ